MLRSLRSLAIAGVFALVGALCTAEVAAQVTTGSMRGSVTDSAGAPIQGARVTATHTPSAHRYVPRGTEYGMPDPSRGCSSPRWAHTAGSGMKEDEVSGL